MIAAQSASVIRKFGELPIDKSGAVVKKSIEDSKSIWKEEEVLSVHEALSAPDDRKRPEFDFGYKQRVGSEDVFLGLSGTTESSIHCDTLVMRIFLPGERLADVDLDCTEERILVSSANLCVYSYVDPSSWGELCAQRRKVLPAPLRVHFSSDN